MSNYNGKLIELPKHGKAIVVTDLHGNLNDYKRYMGIWEKCRDDNTHFILTGDFIHAMGRKEDRSIEILESVKQNWEKFEDFHPLLGNHEWSTISRVSVFKGGINQSLTFDELLKERFGENWKMKLEEYQDFFKKLPIAVKTDNKVFISHAGPSQHLKSENDIKNISDNDYSGNLVLYDMLWNRNMECSRNYLDPFLRYLNCNVSIVGHTPVNGFELHGNQLVVSSSFGFGKKAYVELNLENDVNNGVDLLNMVKSLD